MRFSHFSQIDRLESLCIQNYVTVHMHAYIYKWLVRSRASHELELE